MRDASELDVIPQGEIMVAALIVIAFVSLIGVRFIPRSGRLRHAWFILCIINLTAVAIISFGSFKKDRKIRMLESDIVAVREYSAVARRDALGNPPQGEELDLTSSSMMN